MDRGRDVVVDGVHEVLNGLDPLLVVRSVVVQSTVSGGVDDRAVAVEAVLVEEVADLFFDELDELLISTMSHLFRATRIFGTPT